ncbi:HEPN domain-containing protein [Mycobacteroides abscessus]|uniref:ApeA N-terminal domain 1-containing protein n=1 Tax=Mycobacteroides abscessus TaxID=36809 RepID=UPI0002DBF861|nr:HEPN domain-containing protein [Mycobacteroides abscessus]
MSAADQIQPVKGTFWQADTPHRRVPGELMLTDSPILEILGRIFDERSNRVTISEHGGTTISYTGDPEDSVADFEPRDIHGVLEDGTAVSIVGAQGGKKHAGSFYDWKYRQQFRSTRHVLVGEHVEGDRQTYQDCRFQIAGANWWGTTGGQAQAQCGGTLILETDGDQLTFHYTPAEPQTIRELDWQALSPVASLVSLATHNPTGAIQLRVRRTEKSPWMAVHRRESAPTARSHELLPARLISPQQYAAWIDFQRITDGLDTAAIDRLPGVAIQTEVLALAAIAEGLHQRIYDADSRIPALSRSDMQQARRAARKAALEKVRQIDRTGREPLSPADLTEFGQAMNDSFSFINKPTYRSRMADFVAEAQSIIPGIVGAFNDWPAAVKDIRNILAHQGTELHSETLDQFHDVLIALSYSIPWVLRTVLLARAGFDPATLREAYELSSQYNLHLANTRNLLIGGPYAQTATDAPASADSSAAHR